jgi:hypothetical protein
LLEIGLDVVDVLDIHGNPHQVRSHTAGGLLLERQLLVGGGAGWMTSVLVSPEKNPEKNP